MPSFSRANDNSRSLKDELVNLEAAVRENSGDAISHYNLASAYHEIGLREKSIVEYKVALKIDPDFPEAHNNLGLVYFQLGKNEDAVSEYEKALSLFPDYPEAHFGLGIAHYLKNEETKALQHLQRAEELFDFTGDPDKRKQVTKMLTIIKMKSRKLKDMF